MNGNQFRQAREDADLTLEEVAKAMGLRAYQSVQRYDSAGENEITIKAKYWPVLAELFNIPIESFIPKRPLAAVLKSLSGEKVAQTTSRDKNAVLESIGIEKLTAKEAYTLSLKRRYDPAELLWDKYTKKLLEIKKIHD